MGANNASMLILSKCVNVRHRFHIRVHHPDTTRALAESFDQKVEDVLKVWFGPLSEDQIDLARLPIKQGGLGLSATFPLRQSAYEAAKHAVLER